MYTGFIASRYATALYEFADGNSQNGLVYSQVRALIDVFTGNRNLFIAFQSPVTTLQIKLEAVREMLSQPLCESMEKFIILVVNHNREKFFLFMLHSYVKIYKERQNIVDVTITTASPIDSDLARKIASAAGEDIKGKEVEVLQKVNPNIIGGFIVRVNNKLINASIGRQISLLKQKYE